jgi:DNA-binding transcriptional MerR regulator
VLHGEETSGATGMEIPDKLFFRIGEVSSLLGLEPHVLRFWESEFPALTPKKSDTGQRLYRRKDVELLLRIKELLYEKRYTIEGARQLLGDRKVPRRSRQQTLFESDPLPEIRKELVAILDMLR